MRGLYPVPPSFAARDLLRASATSTTFFVRRRTVRIFDRTPETIEAK
jgi:hypothetical protein